MLSAVTKGSKAAFCVGGPSPDAQPNVNPIYQASSDAPSGTLINHNEHGSVYRFGEGDDAVNVVHLWGDAYTMGYAQGTLLKDDVVGFTDGVWDFFKESFVMAINGTVPWIPQEAADTVAEIGLEVALDLTYDATHKFTGDYFFDEIRGLCDASGADYDKVMMIAMKHL